MIRRTILILVCAVMTSASLTAQTVKSPLSAKDLKAKQAAELKAFKEKQKKELDEFIAQQKDPELAKFRISKPELKDSGDTLAYIFGAFQANGLKKHIHDQLHVDTTNTAYMEAFYRGILSKVDIDHTDSLLHRYLVRRQGYARQGRTRLAQPVQPTRLRHRCTPS